MQKFFAAIALALTLTSAFAGFTPYNFSKAPVQVAVNNETNFTNTNVLGLGSVFSSSDLSLYSYNSTVNSPNTSYATFFKQLSTKDLSAASPKSLSFNATLTSISGFFFSNNWAIAVAFVTSGTNYSIQVYQQPLSGGAPLQVYSVANSTTQLTYLGNVISGGNFYVFYQSDTNLVTCSNFAIGGTAGTLTFILTQAYTGGFSLATGGALNNQALAIWNEGVVLKEGLINLNTGTVTVTTIGNYSSTYTCAPYVTDKSNYGEICFNKNSNSTTTYYIKSTNSSLTFLFVGQTNQNQWFSNFAYNSYLGVITTNTSVTGNTTYNYAIIDVANYVFNKNNTLILNTNGTTIAAFPKINEGLYAFIYDVNGVAANPNNTNIYVGLVLGSSYLASVLGFLLTIIAGLLLF